MWISDKEKYCSIMGIALAISHTKTMFSDGNIGDKYRYVSIFLNIESIDTKIKISTKELYWKLKKNYVDVKNCKVFGTKY